MIPETLASFPEDAPQGDRDNAEKMNRLMNVALPELLEKENQPPESKGATKKLHGMQKKSKASRKPRASKNEKPRAYGKCFLNIFQTVQGKTDAMRMGDKNRKQAKFSELIAHADLRVKEAEDKLKSLRKDKERMAKWQKFLAETRADAELLRDTARLMSWSYNRIAQVRLL